MNHPQKIAPKKTSKKWLLWLLAAGLILTALAVIFVPKWIEQSNREILSELDYESPVKELYRSEENAIVSIWMDPVYGEAYELIPGEDGLLYLNENGTPTAIKEDLSTEIVEIFTCLTSQETIADSSEGITLSEMGLDPAQGTALVCYADGTQITVEIGDDIPETGYSYMRWSGDDGIYAADEGMQEAFSRSSDRLLPFEQIEIVSDLAEQIEIQNQYGKAVLLISENAEGTTTAKLTEPYEYPVDSETTESLLSSLSSFRLGSVANEVNDENAADYGFSPAACRITIHQGAGYRSDTDENGALLIIPVEAQSYTIEIGMETKEHFYYCRYGGQYYLISKYLVQTPVNFSSENAAMHQPMNLGDCSITKLVLQYGGQSYVLTATYTEAVVEEAETGSETEETAEESEITYTAEYVLNGKTLSQESMEEIVDSLNEITVSGKLDAAFAPTGEPLWQLELTDYSGDVRTITAYAYDTFTHAFSLNGVFLHLLNAETIDVLVNLLGN